MTHFCPANEIMGSLDDEANDEQQVTNKGQPGKESETLHILHKLQLSCI